MKNYHNDLEVIGAIYGKMFQKRTVSVAEINQFTITMDKIIAELKRYSDSLIGYTAMSGSEVTQGTFAGGIVFSYYFDVFPYVKNVISTMSGYFTAPEQARFAKFNTWFADLNAIEAKVLTNNGR